jgi:hypothetical protein
MLDTQIPDRLLPLLFLIFGAGIALILAKRYRSLAGIISFPIIFGTFVSLSQTPNLVNILSTQLFPELPLWKLITCVTVFALCLRGERPSSSLWEARAKLTAAAFLTGLLLTGNPNSTMVLISLATGFYWLFQVRYTVYFLSGEPPTKLLRRITYPLTTAILFTTGLLLVILFINDIQKEIVLVSVMLAMTLNFYYRFIRLITS